MISCISIFNCSWLRWKLLMFRMHSPTDIRFKAISLTNSSVLMFSAARFFVVFGFIIKTVLVKMGLSNFYFKKFDK